MSPSPGGKLVRDPLYGFIDLSGKELEIVDTEAFRRLQLIKQLSHAYVAYPTAVHTRFEHLLGTLHVSGRMSEVLGLGEERTATVRMACLLHDIGHGPFSHLFEHVLEKLNPGMGEPHERVSRAIIEGDSEIDGILGPGKEGVLELLARKPSGGRAPAKNVDADIVSSALDADKMDYLRRDSYHIGVQYGNFDFERIMRNIGTTDSSGPHADSAIVPPHICIGNKGRDALESCRLARHLMHAQVYEHHARLSADQMFLRALEIAISDESVIDADLLRFRPGNAGEFLEYYGSLNDFSIYEKILGDPNARISGEILGRIRRRKLLKRACEFIPSDLRGSAPAINTLFGPAAADHSQITSRIAEKVGVQEHEVILYKSTINNKLYKRGQIFCRDHRGRIVFLEEISPITGVDTEKFFVFGPASPGKRAAIAAEMAKLLGVEPGVIASADSG